MSGVPRRRHRLDDPGHLLLLADRTLAIRRIRSQARFFTETETETLALGETAARRANARQAPRVLDIGCGAGDSLATFVAACGPCDVTGVDPDPARVAVARDRIRPGRFEAGDGRELRFEHAAFDVALLFTVLSSVPDDADRRRIASEALRVVRPGGGVLLYDFAVNPVNRRTRGLSPREARILFPGCAFHEERLTPLPALVRRLARTGRPRTWLARLPVPRTHHLTWISKT